MSLSQIQGTMPLVIGLATVISFTIAWLLKTYALTKAILLDQPGGRKMHMEATPVIGGLAIFGTFYGLVAWQDISLITGYWPLMVGVLGMVMLGVVDDIVNMKASTKLIIQIGIAIVSLMASLQTLSEGPLSGYLVLFPILVFCMATFINAFNMTDGIDGLAGSLALVTVLPLGVIAAKYESPDIVMLLGTLAGSVIGFLMHNARSPWRKKASVFMGDAGSLTLGFVLSWFCLKIWDMTATLDNPVPLSVLMWVLAYPTMDAALVALRRILAGKHPFHPDRTHLHHYLAQLNCSVSFIVSAIVAISVIYTFIGFALWRNNVSELSSILLLFAGFISYGIIIKVMLEPAAEKRQSNQFNIQDPYKPS